MRSSATKIDTLRVPTSVKQIAQRLIDRGYEAFCVGGCVRDTVLQIKPKDWDIATNAKPEEIETLFEHTFSENEYGTVTVVLDDQEDETLKQVEITPFRREGGYSDKRRPDAVSFDGTLEEDCARRDFTINALALNPVTGELYDFHGGVRDLHEGIVRAVGDPDMRFGEDALRLLRAVRIAGNLSCTIEQNTLGAIERAKDAVRLVAAERVREEFFRMVSSQNTFCTFNLFYSTGLLDILIPELAGGVGVEQNKAHAFDVFTHNIKTLEHAVKKKQPLHIRLAAIFHDVSKPETQEWSEKKGTYTFHNHEIVGAKTTKDILERLKVPGNLSKKAVRMVRWHMFFSDTEKVTATGVRRLLSKVGEEMMWELIDLRMCDRVGTGRPVENPYRLRQYTALLEEVLRDPITPGQLAINGSDLMSVLNEKPGKMIGDVLSVLLSETLETPETNTKEALLARAKELHALGEKEVGILGKKAKEMVQAVEQSEIEAINRKYRVER